MSTKGVHNTTECMLLNIMQYTLYVFSVDIRFKPSSVIFIFTETSVVIVNA